MSTESQKNRPAHEIRMANLKAVIWRNSTKNGDVFNVQVRRVFKQEEEWKESDSLGRDDLLLAGKICDAAHSWILSQHERQQKS